MAGRSFRECREAAASVRRAEFGRAAVERLRGDRLLGFFRERPGLAPLLFLAAAQKRLVWRSPHSFALLESPRSLAHLLDTGRRSRWARRMERWWPQLSAYSPAIVILVLMPLALLTGPYALLAASLAGLLVTLYAVVLMTAVLVHQLRLAARRFRRPGSGHQVPFDRLLGDSWSIGLLHTTEPDQVDSLLSNCLERTRGLAVDVGNADGVLLCPDMAVTTGAARNAVTNGTAATPLEGFDEGSTVVRLPGDPAPSPSNRPVPFVRTFVAGVVVWFLAVALDLAERERSTCAAEACDRTPDELP